jgi:hypothetical protein
MLQPEVRTADEWQQPTRKDRASLIINRLATVDFSAMSDAIHAHNVRRIIYLVNDPIFADANPPIVIDTVNFRQPEGRGFFANA